MPLELTKIIRPAVDGSDINYGPFPAGWDRWDCVDPGDPVSHDDDASYIARGSGGSARDHTQKSDGTFPQATVITEVLHKARRRKPASANSGWEVLLALSATKVYKLMTIQVAWTTHSFDYTNDRPGGGSWTDDDFRDASFEFGIKHKSNGGANECTSLWLEVKYVPEEEYIEALREVFSRKLRRSRFPEDTYSLPVPIEFLALELLDDLNISHDSLPRAATLLQNLAVDQLVKDWQRMYALHIKQTVNLNDMSMVVDFSNAEPHICYFWCTEKLPFAVSDKEDGLAIMDVGSLWTFTRDSVAWLEQSDGRVVPVSSNLEKRNHIGYLSEDGNTDLILNSNFQDGYASIWTQTLGGTGTIANDTTVLIFPVSVTPQSCKITKGTGDTYQTQGSLSVLAGDGYRTLAIYYITESGSIPLGWRLQRASDSWYWNDSTPGWQSGSVFNQFAGSATWTRGFSAPIVADATTTWTLDFGCTTGLEGDGVWVGQVDLVLGRYICSPLITDNSGTFTSQNDTRKGVLTDASPVRQQYPARRVTGRLTLTAENAASRMGTNDKLILIYGQIDNTGNNYDYVYYEKPAGNARIVYERKLSGQSAVLATKEFDLARGTAYEIGWRATYQGELNLSNYTLSVFVDGVKGTDVQAAGGFSEAADDSELWIGDAPAALMASALRPHNYMSNIEIMQRCYPDEEMLARR